MTNKNEKKNKMFYVADKKKIKKKKKQSYDSNAISSKPDIKSASVSRKKASLSS